MANTLVPISGAAVLVAIAVAGSINSGANPTEGQFVLYDTSGNAIAPSQAVPATGPGVTVGNFQVINTGATTTVGGHNYPNLTIQSLINAKAGVGYGVAQMVGGAVAKALFDVTVPATHANLLTALKSGNRVFPGVTTDTMLQHLKDRHIIPNHVTEGALGTELHKRHLLPLGARVIMGDTEYLKGSVS